MSKITLKPLPKRITNEIRRILEGCHNGVLQHDQEQYHCGTSHCIAGWRNVKAFQKETKTRSFDPYSLEYQDWKKRQPGFIPDGGTGPYSSEWNIAQEAWGLTDGESDELFGMYATFDQQFAMLQILESGERLPDNDDS